MSSSASSEVDLANMALTMLGQQPIAALSDNNNRANLVDKRLADVRDSVLRAHQWNCCVKRATLSAHGTAPVWGYSNRYQVPTDFIRLVATESNTTDYRIEAGNQGESPLLFILTDDTEMKILYIAKITSVAQMDSSLVHAIACRLAADIAVAVTGDAGQETAMMQKYQIVLAQAVFEDSASHSPLETIRGGEWLEARLNSGAYRDFPPLNGGGEPL
tara:strand:+ start:1636 stop:2286 length:651 start_codon:yes stop_codon:yes gene_type:complete